MYHFFVKVGIVGYNNGLTGKKEVQGHCRMAKTEYWMGLRNR